MNRIVPKISSVFKMYQRKSFCYPELEKLEKSMLDSSIVSADCNRIVEGNLNYGKREKTILFIILYILCNLRLASILFWDPTSGTFQYLGDGMTAMGVTGRVVYIAQILVFTMIISLRVVFTAKEGRNQLHILTDFRFLMPKNQKSVINRLRAANRLRLYNMFEKRFHQMVVHLAVLLRHSYQSTGIAAGCFFFLAGLYSAFQCPTLVSALFCILSIPVQMFFCSYGARDMYLPYGIMVIAINYITLRFEQFSFYVQRLIDAPAHKIQPKDIDFLVRDYIHLTQCVFRCNMVSKWLMVVFDYTAVPVICGCLYTAFLSGDGQSIVLRSLFVFFSIQFWTIAQYMSMAACSIHSKAKSSYPLLNRLFINLATQQKHLSVRQKQRVMMP